MDETVGMLSVTAALVLGIWLVDYSGDVSRASAGVRSAAVEAAEYTAAALATAPTDVSGDEVEGPVARIAEQVVSAAAIGDCDVADQRFEVTAQVHRLPASKRPAAVSVEVDCPLSVSPIFTELVNARVAVPVPEDPAAQP